LAVFTQGVQAVDVDSQALALAKQNACLGCHAIDKKIVGPSFKSVAMKYQSTPNAQTIIQNKIQNGGSGSWGVVPMPANKKLSNGDLVVLTAWILRGAPSGNH
jgi:cytochrome c